MKQYELNGIELKVYSIIQGFTSTNIGYVVNIHYIEKELKIDEWELFEIVSRLKSEGLVYVEHIQASRGTIHIVVAKGE